MDLSIVMNYVLGGGLLGTIVAIITLKSTVKEANAKAEKAKAEAEALRIDNTEHATRILLENIVEPLKKELSETREELRNTNKEFESTKREMARLRKAIGEANSCRHHDDCPVLYGLREFAKEHEGGDAQLPVKRKPRSKGKENVDDGRDSEICRETLYSSGQPP